MATEALITPRMLRWAREREQKSAADTARRLNVPLEKIEAWESGRARPTLRQARSLAEHLHVPFGYFYLLDPPDERLPVPDLRTVAGAPAGPPSPELRDVLHDALEKQEWLREYRRAEGSTRLACVGRFSMHDDPRVVAQSIRDAVKLDATMRTVSVGIDEFCRRLIQATEAIGVVVLRNGVVGNNTHRPLHVSEFRGFALSDDLAPLIFVNGRDAKVAQVFTIAHELVHIWVGQSGISNPDALDAANAIEQFCNRVAAEMFLPSDEFLARWKSSDSVVGNVEALSSIFHVSRLVVLRHALDRNLITQSEFQAGYAQVTEHPPERSTPGEGGDFYRSLLVRNSQAFTMAVLNALADGRALHRDAARLLNVRVDLLDDVMRRTFHLGAPSGA